MSDMPEADWPGEWPLRVYILHPDVKNFGDMVTAPERREYISADKVQALVEALRPLLRFAENTESELGIVLDSADLARAALAALDAKGESHE